MSIFRTLMRRLVSPLKQSTVVKRRGRVHQRCAVTESALEDRALLATFQDFDSVTAPSLPAGWNQATTGNVSSFWQTFSSGGVGNTGHVFITGQSNVSDTSLTSPTVAIHAANTQLKFQHTFNLDTEGQTYYDGAMLEISIGGGAFNDIIAAGGAFVQGGYNGSVSSATTTLTPNRSCWGGNSNGFITTTVNLPASANGQNVQFRWRFSSDIIVASPGWGIDSIELNDTDSDDQISEASVVALNTTVTNTIGHGRDVDMYAFDVAAGQTVAFDVDFATSGGMSDSEIRLFDAAGTQLARNDDTNAPGETASSARESFLRYTFATGGCYYLGVASYGNSHYSANTGDGDTNSTSTPGGYSLRLDPTPDLVDIIDVSPDPRYTNVSSIDFEFSEAIDLTTLTVADLSLRRDSNLITLSGNETISHVAGSVYRIEGLSEETEAAGVYEFSITGNGITDPAGNPGSGIHSENWTRVPVGPYVVTQAADENDGDFSSSDLSLREAVFLSNLVPGPDSITFSPSLDNTTLLLSGSELVLTDPGGTTITGSGARHTFLLGNGTNRIFRVAAGAFADIELLSMSSGRDVRGGGILNEGALTLFAVYIGSCYSIEDGGAVYSSGDLFVENSSFSNNYAELSGGAIGVYLGGIATIVNSTIAYNVAGYFGGGMDVNDSAATVINSTIVGNYARANSSSSGNGGGISNFGSITLYNSLVAGNYNVSTSLDDDISNELLNSSSSHNLIGTAATSGGLMNGVDGNIVGVDGSGTRPLSEIIDVFGDFGGLTPGMALTANSVAINAGSASLVPQGVSFEQRGAGFQRIVEAVDIGAFEVQTNNDADDTVFEAPVSVLNASRNGYLNGGYDVDMVAFDAAAGATISFDVDSIGEVRHENTVLRISDSSGTQLAIDDNSDGPGIEGDNDDAYLRHTFAVAGRYYVAVSSVDNPEYNPRNGESDNGGATLSGIYTLHISSDPTATINIADMALKTGETSLVTFTFSEPVTGFSNADLTVENGTLSPVATSDEGMTWQAVFTPSLNITDTSNAIVLNNTGYTDRIGMPGVGSTVSANYSIDTARPGITIQMSDTALIAGETAVVTFNFTEPVMGFTNADLTISNGVLSFVSSSNGGQRWTAVFTPTVGVMAASNVITINNAGYTDSVGNAGAGTTDSGNYQIDTQRPTVTIGMSDLSLVAGETSLVTFLFSERVTGFANADLVVANGSLSSVTTADSGRTWTATYTPAANTTDLTNVLAINNSGIADIAGNAGVGTTSSLNYTIDTQRPTVTVSFSDQALRIGETSVVTMTFSEPVIGFGNTDVLVSNGTLSSLTSANGGRTWTGTFTPAANTQATSNQLRVVNTDYTDVAGNSGLGQTTSPNFLIDTLRPTATIAMSDTALKFGDGATVTFIFSEPITAFSTADLTVANGSLTSPTSTNNGMIWTARFTPRSNVSATTGVITLNNLTYTDLAGNSGTGSTVSPSFTIDTTRPSVAMSLSDTALRVGEYALASFVFSEAVTGFTSSDVQVANGSLSPVATTDGGRTWVAVFTPTSNITDPSNILTLSNASYTDLAGNIGVVTSVSGNYTIDTQRPTATVTLSDTALKIGETARVTLTFSEPITGLTVSRDDMIAEDGVLSGLASSDGGRTWTATLTPRAARSSVGNVLTVYLAGVTDAAGNSGIATVTSPAYAVDTVRPTATISMSDTDLLFGETSTVTLTFSEPVVGLTNTDVTTQNGTLGSLVSASGGLVWTGVFTAASHVLDLTNQLSLNNAGYTDVSGNSGSGTTLSANYAVKTQLDFGDLPNTFGTLLTSNGARHRLGNGLTLGVTASGDIDGRPSPAGTLDSDDGVTGPTTLTPGSSNAFSVVSSAAGKLDVFVDFNRNGVFETSERITPSTGSVMVQGTNRFLISIPSTAPSGLYATRFRLSSAGGLQATGLAADGEVEDYFVQVVRPSTTSQSAARSTSADASGSAFTTQGQQLLAGSASRTSSIELSSAKVADVRKLPRSTSLTGTITGISPASADDDLSTLDLAMTQFSDDWLFPLSTN